MRAKMRLGAVIAPLGAALAAALILAACAPRLPTEEPSITGEVTSLTRGDGIVTLLVEAPPRPPESSYAPLYDKASVTVTRDTDIFEADGTVATIERLEQGQRVRAWFTGAVAESYPVQARASAVQVLVEAP